MSKLCDKVLQKIKEENIEPKPRWQFLLEDCFVWAFFLVALVVGGLAFCVILHVFSTNDWDIYTNLKRSWLTHILIALPYIWLGILALFIFLAHYNYRHTKRGYRAETFWVVILSIAGSFIFGLVLHFTNLGERMENALFEKIPVTGQVSCCSHRKDIWNQPDKGLLGGEILKIESADKFDLKDFSGVVWVVEENENTLVRRPVAIIENEKIKIIGEVEKGKEGTFRAFEIRPWQY